MNPFFIGANLIPNGIRLLIRFSSLRFWACIPLLINFTCLVLIFWVGWGYFSPIVDSGFEKLLPADRIWSRLVFYAVSFFIWVIFVFLLVFLSYVLALLLAGPFHSILVEKTFECLAGGLQSKSLSKAQWLKKNLRLFWISIAKMLILLPIVMALFIFSFIPGLNFIAIIGTWMIMGYDAADYSFEVVGWSLSERYRFWRRHIKIFGGLSAVIGLTTLIPGLNFLLFPAAVTGAAEHLFNLQKTKDTPVI